MSETEAQENLREILLSLHASPRSDDLWKALYAETRRFVFAVAYRVLGGDGELAKDATQNVFLRVFQYCEFTDFSQPSDFLGYLSTITRHVALDLAHKEQGFVTGLELALSDFLPSRATPRQKEKAQNQLRNVFEHLSADERILVDLLMEGYTLEEIAERLAIRYSTAAVRIHRLRERLVKYLETG
jgi:RNA polymerase sigma factor (sigma-70 family)